MTNRPLILKVFQNEIFFVLLLFPLIRPRGVEIPFRRVYQLIVLLIILVISLRNTKQLVENKFMRSVVPYFLLMIIISGLKSNVFGEGLEKLFIAPAICVFYSIWMCKNPKLTIKATVDLLLLEQIISILTWKVNYGGSSTTMFMGIRTVYGILAILCIFYSLLYFQFCEKQYRWKCYLLIIFSLIEVFGKWISTGIVAVVALFIIFFVYGRRAVEKSQKLKGFYNATILTISGFVLNFFVCFVQIQKYFSKIIIGVLGESLNLNGRAIIWERTISRIAQSPILGYGVYGTRVEMSQYWGTGDVAYNYVHNQLLQVLLDGGIVLLISFIILHLFLSVRINGLRNGKIRAISAAALFAFLLVMIAEEPGNYMFYFPFIAVVGNLDKLEEQLLINPIKEV